MLKGKARENEEKMKAKEKRIHSQELVFEMESSLLCTSYGILKINKILKKLLVGPVVINIRFGRDDHNLIPYNYDQEEAKTTW